MSEIDSVVPAAVGGVDSRSALLLVNGDCHESTLARCRQMHPDLLIAVDGGLRHCRALGAEPDLLIGDLDSASEAELAGLDDSKTRVIRYPAEKDQTDLELALRHAQAENVTQMMLAGLSGGRTDQMLCNWLLLGQTQWGFNIDVLDDRGCGYLVVAERGRRITVEPGATISLLALTQNTSGVSTQGLMYPLCNAELPLGSSLGISNIAHGDEFVVSITQGVLLAYVNDAA